MGTRKTVANVVGLAGCGAIGYGVYGLTLEVGKVGGACGDVGQAPCPASMGPYVAWLVGGIVVGVGAMIAGGALAFGGLFLAIGLGSLATVPGQTGGQRLFGLLFGGGFTLAGLVPLLAIPWYLVRKKRAMALVETGVRGLGTVTAVEETGVTINDQPRVIVKFRIEPQDGTPVFTGEKKMLVSLLDPIRVGQRYPVLFDRDDHTRLGVITKVEDGAPPDIARLAVIAAQTSTTCPSGFAGLVPPARAEQVPDRDVDETPLDRLAKLNALRLAGGLTDEEYQVQKQRLLSQGI